MKNTITNSFPVHFLTLKRIKTKEEKRERNCETLGFVLLNLLWWPLISRFKENQFLFRLKGVSGIEWSRKGSAVGCLWETLDEWRETVALRPVLSSLETCCRSPHYLANQTATIHRLLLFSKVQNVTVALGGRYHANWRPTWSTQRPKSARIEKELSRGRDEAQRGLPLFVQGHK